MSIFIFNQRIKFHSLNSGNMKDLFKNSNIFNIEITGHPSLLSRALRSQSVKRNGKIKMRQNQSLVR